MRFIIEARRVAHFKFKNLTRNIGLLVTLINLKFVQPYRINVTNVGFGSLARWCPVAHHP